MSETYHVQIVCSHRGRGCICFFDEPFGEQTPFEWAGGYSAFFDSGITDGGPITSEELARGLDAWLEHRGWRRLEEVEAAVEI
jgi:hypothetical protein